MWEWYERRVRKDTGKSDKPEAVVAALQLYSDKTQVTHKGNRNTLVLITQHLFVKNITTHCHNPVQSLPFNIGLLFSREVMPPHQSNFAEYTVQQEDQKLPRRSLLSYIL